MKYLSNSPDNISLADVQKMAPREFRQWNFMKMNDMARDIKKTEKTMRRLDTRIWGVLIGIVVILATVIGSAVF